MCIVFSEICEDRQPHTHRQTHNMITIPFSVYFAARVKIQNSLVYSDLAYKLYIHAVLEAL